MLLHDVRRHPAKGILFHWSNLKHWRETAPLRSRSDTDMAKWFRDHQYPRSSCRGLMAILQMPTSLQSAHELLMILDPAAAIIGAYFSALDQQTIAHDGAFSSLDGVEIFSAGIGLMYIMQTRESTVNMATAQSEPASQMLFSVQKPLQLLARISDRFTGLRCLGEVLQNFALALCNVPAQRSASSSLKTILGSFESTIPRPVTSLMLNILELRYEHRT